MRRTAVFCCLCLLLTSCTVGIKRDEVVITAAPTLDVSATQEVIVATRVAATVAALKPTSVITSFATVTPLSPTVVVVPAATAAPVAAPSSPKPVTAPAPSIQNFTANTDEIAPNELVTLAWASTGGSRATLSAGSWERDVPLSGSMTVDSQGAGGHWHDYVLTVWNNAGTTATKSLTVQFHCSYVFFFTPSNPAYSSVPRLCPDGPTQSTAAAEQTFDGGRMIWLEHATSLRQWTSNAGGKDDFVILVLYHTSNYGLPQFQVFTDAWLPSEPDSDPNLTPPQNRFQPIRGFGKVWRTHPEVKQRLGWALDQEKAFSSTHQSVAGFEWTNAHVFVRNIDNRVIGLNLRSGAWSYVAP